MVAAGERSLCTPIVSATRVLARDDTLHRRKKILWPGSALVLFARKSAAWATTSVRRKSLTVLLLLHHCPACSIPQTIFILEEVCIPVLLSFFRQEQMNEYEGELEKFCVEHQLGVVTYSSLASGFLTGKYRREAPVPQTQRAAGVQQRYWTGLIRWLFSTTRLRPRLPWPGCSPARGLLLPSLAQQPSSSFAS